MFLKSETPFKKKTLFKNLFFIFPGTFKYGLYEVFKNVYSEFLGEEKAYLYRTSMYLVNIYFVS
jgi:hypothetical protein